MRVLSHILTGAVGGVLVFLFVNTSCHLMQTSGSQSLITWVGEKAHDRLRRPGEALGRRRYTDRDGREHWCALPGYRKLPYLLGPGMVVGFGAGGGVALARALLRHQRRPPSFLLPVSWPMLMVLAGTLVYGHLLGMVAFFLVGRTRARPWFAALTRLVAVGVALFWGVGTELYWGPGWSNDFPWLARLLSRVFGDDTP
jgi:hypothetical protein